MRSNLPGQLEIPRTESRPEDLARLKSTARMRPPVAQLACDLGLFSDEANQLDLIEMFMD